MDDGRLYLCPDCGFEAQGAKMNEHMVEHAEQQRQWREAGYAIIPADDMTMLTRRTVRG